MANNILVSKKTFIEKNIISADDNDASNDNKCTFCWAPYDEQHPGVRILPCNHFFGRDCLVEMINAPNGDVCPICRTLLFRPSLGVAFDRLLSSAIEHFTFYMIAAIHKLHIIELKLSEMVDAMPQWLQPWLENHSLRLLVRLCLNVDNVYYYAELMVNHFTNLPARNPHLDLNHAKQCHWPLLALYKLLHYFHPNPYGGVLRVFMSIQVAVLFSLAGVHGRFSNLRDRFVFVVIMNVALVLQMVVIAFMFGDNMFPIDSPSDTEAQKQLMAEAR